MPYERTPEHRAAVRALLQRPDVVEARLQAMRRPEVRAKISRAKRLADEQPQVRERNIAAIRAAMQRPEVRERISAGRKAQLARQGKKMSRAQSLLYNKLRRILGPSAARAEIMRGNND